MFKTEDMLNVNLQLYIGLYLEKFCVNTNSINYFLILNKITKN